MLFYFMHQYTYLLKFFHVYIIVYNHVLFYFHQYVFIPLAVSVGQRHRWCL